MAKKKRAFVKYTKKGKIIPGSLIVGTSGGYPKDGLYEEVTPNLCCETPQCFKTILQGLFDSIPIDDPNPLDTLRNILFTTNLPASLDNIGYTTTCCTCSSCSTISSFGTINMASVETFLKFYEGIVRSGDASSLCCLGALSSVETFLKFQEAINSFSGPSALCCPNVLASIETYLKFSEARTYSGSETPICGCNTVFGNVPQYFKYWEATNRATINSAVASCPCNDVISSYERYVYYCSVLGVPATLPEPITPLNYVSYGSPTCGLTPTQQSCVLALEAILGTECLQARLDYGIIDVPGQSNTYLSCQLQDIFSSSSDPDKCEVLQNLQDKGVVHETDAASQNAGEKLITFLDKGIDIDRRLDKGTVQSGLFNQHDAFYKLNVLYSAVGAANINMVVDRILDKGLLEYGNSTDGSAFFTAIEILAARPDMTETLMMDFIDYLLDRSLVMTFGPDCKVSITCTEHYLQVWTALNCTTSNGYTDFTTGIIDWSRFGTDTDGDYLVDYSSEPATMYGEGTNTSRYTVTSFLTCYCNDGSHDTDGFGNQYPYIYWNSTPAFTGTDPDAYFRIIINGVIVFESVAGVVTVAPVSYYFPLVPVDTCLNYQVTIESYAGETGATFGYDFSFGYD